jgi:toxin ParE1/3/4
MAHRLAPQVVDELDEIWYFFAGESGDAGKADRLVDAITERFWLLAAHPHVGRRRDDLRPGLRSFPVGDYLIIYRIEERDVLIVHVLHGRRDIAAFMLNET